MINIFKGGFLTAIFICFTNFSYAEILLNDNILNTAIEQNISMSSKQIYELTGVNIALALSDKKDFDSLKNYEANLSKPYILLIFSKVSHKVDILASDDALKFFDKEAVLSPYPEQGTILPILANPKQKDIYNAAILNGYADIADQVANHFKIKPFYGNSNRDTLNIMRILIYGFLCVAILMLVQRKVKRRR
ncbi:putative membrane protein [Campylobacter sp. RM16704]|nr:putative membrane protein [Campylobacter sp. RM16704]